MGVEALAADLLKQRAAERPGFVRLRDYVRGKQPPVYVPEDARDEYKWLVARAKVNVVGLVETAKVETLAVDNYRLAPVEVDGVQQLPADVPSAAAWAHWQANRMDARQAGIYRSAVRYGSAFVLVVPGDGVPVWRAYSPLTCTTVYGDAEVDEWPAAALIGAGLDIDGNGLLDLWTPEGVYEVTVGKSDGKAAVTGERANWYGQVPVVRYRNRMDVDGDDVTGEIEGLTDLQDQVNFTTYGLLMAQLFAAFRQRYVTGMVPQEDATGRPVAPFNAAVNRLFVGEDPDTRFGEFDQTDLSGYLSSREKTLQIMASVAQMPPHAFGAAAMVNLSAEAMASLELQRQRDNEQRQTSFGESHEQAFRLSASAVGDAVGAADTSAEVVWRDTNAQSLAQTVDALGKEVTMLGVPPQLAWEDIPGWTAQKVNRAKAMAADADAMGQLVSVLSGQDQPAATDAGGGGDVKAKADALGTLIRAGVDPQDAAREVGLDGLDFTGAVPVSLRLPESDATSFEG